MTHTSVRQKKAEQPIQPVPDTEDVGLVVKSGNVTDLDGAEGPFDRRIAALCKKGFSAAPAGCLLRAEYRREGQETLVDIVI